MSVIITSPASPTPSDNRIVFAMLGDLGTGQTITPEGNNAIGLMLENVSGDYTDGVWNVVEPLEDSDLSFIRLPNVGTELIIALFEAAGIAVPEDLPDDLDRYRPNNLTMTFVSGATATLAGEFISVDNTDYVWDVSIEFDTPVNYATWSGGGGVAAAIVEDFPLNRLVFSDGMATAIAESDVQLWCGNDPLTDYTNDGTVITFSNTGYAMNALTAPALAIFQAQLQAGLLEAYMRPADAESFTNLPLLQKLHLLDVALQTYSGGALVQNNPALVEFLWMGVDADNLFGAGLGDVSSLSRIFMPNAVSINGADTGWLDGVTLATLNLWINVINETNNGGGVQAEVAAVISAGGTVKYNDPSIYPDQFDSSITQVNYTYWLVNSGNSTFDGKTGSPLEGISLTIDDPEDNRPGLQIAEGAFAGSGLYHDGTDGVGVNFTITGATTGSIFFGLNSYSYEIDVLINDTLHSTHRLFFTPGDQVKFDASQITRSVVGRPQLPIIGVGSSQAYGTVQLRVKIRTPEGLLDEEYLSEKVVFWKARLNELNFSNWTPSEWVPSPSDGKFLTTYPRDEKRLILRDANFYIGMFYPGTPEGIEDTLRVRRRQFTEQGGSLLSTATVTPSEVANDGLPDIWKVGIINLGGTSWSNLNTNAGYLLIDLYETDVEAVYGESLPLTVWEGDCNYGATVHFLNKYGGLESFYFPRRKLDEARIQSHKTEKNTGEFDLQENGEFAYLLQAADRITLRSDWLTEAVQNWLVVQLYESPFILIEIDEVLIRAYCRETKWKKLTLRNDMLFDVNVEFELAERRYSPLV